MASSKAEVRPRFTAQLDALVKTGENHAQAAQLQEQRHWTEIDKGDWDGNLADLEGLAKPFDGKANAEDYQAAIRDTSSPGTLSDLMVSQLQGEYLASQEQAFRARHRSPVRAMLQAAARRAGHGHPAGVFKRSVQYYVENLLRVGKENA